jgi:hypothetical protein
MTRLAIPAALLAAFLLPVPQTAIAQMLCSDKPKLMERLYETYDEHPVWQGLTSGNGLMEMWGSTDHSTWTLVLTLPNGQACVLSSGSNWDRVEIKKKENQS